MEPKVEQRRAFIINAAYFGVMVVLVLLALRYLVPWLLPFIIGYLIAMMFKPLVRFIVDHTRLGSKLVGFVVLILAYAIIALLLVLGGIKVVDITKDLVSSLLPYYNEVLSPAITLAGETVQSWLGSLSPYFANQSGELLSGFLSAGQSYLIDLSAAALGSLGTLTAKLPGFLLAFFFTIMSSLLISMNYQEIANFLTQQVPERHRKLLFAIKDNAVHSVALYIVAYLKIMCITFVELSIGLLVLGVDGAILVALGVSLFDLLPVLGTGGIMIPWVLITLLGGQFPLALGLLILYLIVTVIRNIIEPRIVGSQLGLHPLLTLVAMYVGFKVVGVLGMIFFPILAQLAVGLHHAGVVKLWK